MRLDNIMWLVLFLQYIIHSSILLINHKHSLVSEQIIGERIIEIGGLGGFVISTVTIISILLFVLYITPIKKWRDYILSMLVTIISFVILYNFYMVI